MPREAFQVSLQTTVHLLDLERMEVAWLLGTGRMDVRMQGQIPEKGRGPRLRYSGYEEIRIHSVRGNNPL